MKYKKHRLYDVTKTQIINAIEDCIVGYKASRNREVLKMRLCDGLTFEELAEEFDMSVNQIKNIVYVNMDKISKHLEVGE